MRRVASRVASGVTLLLLLTSCKEERQAATDVPRQLRRDDAFQALVAAGVTVTAAFMTAQEQPASSEAPSTFADLGELAQEGRVDLAEASAIVHSVHEAMGTRGTISVDQARPILARARALLARSRPPGSRR